MHISSLSLHHVRNVQQAQLQFSPAINYIFGDNGAGKTSILEAIYLLSRGQSFRSTDIKTIISYNEPSFTVYAELEGAHGRKRLGIMRDRVGALTAHMNNTPVLSSSQLQTNLPLQIIYAQTFALVEGAPSIRRRFFDWGVFHVEHNYKLSLRRFHKVLKQRNELLRRGKIDDELAVWDRQFIDAGVEIDNARSNYLQQLNIILNELIVRVLPDLEIGFEYISGWGHADCDFAVLLKAGLGRDLRYKSTQIGPHRADFVIKANGILAADVLSRGQIKLLCCLLKIAQGYLLFRLGHEAPIFIVDDLAAELDPDNKNLVAELILQLQAQMIITGIDADLQINSSASTTKVFHVEHGTIRTHR